MWTIGPDGGPVAPVVTLAGHESNVRAQAWHPEIPRLCFTGSWDSTVRTWDANDGACLSVNDTHLADVYAIATHPLRPFRAVTCSRDSTIRFWSTEEMCPSAKLYAVVGEDVTRARAAASGAIAGATTATGDPPLSAAPSGTISRRAWRRRGVFASVTPPPSFRSRDTQRRRRCGAWPRSRRTVRTPRARGRVGRDHSAQTRGAGFGGAATDALEAARARAPDRRRRKRRFAPRRRRGSNSATSEGTASSRATSEIGTPPSRPRLRYRSRSGPSSHRRARTLWRRTTMETSTTSCTSDWRRVASTPPWRRCRAPDATTTRFSSRAPPTRDFSTRAAARLKRRAAGRRRREGRVRRRRERRTPRRSTARPRAPRAPRRRPRANVRDRPRWRTCRPSPRRYRRRSVVLGTLSRRLAPPGETRRSRPFPRSGAKPRSRRYTPPTDTLDATIPRAGRGPRTLGEGWREAPCGGRRETPFADRDPLDPYTSPPFARRRARRD